MLARAGSLLVSASAGARRRERRLGEAATARVSLGRSLCQAVTVTTTRGEAKVRRNANMPVGPDGLTFHRCCSLGCLRFCVFGNGHLTGLPSGLAMVGQSSVQMVSV